jgi:ATP-binding cassette subfamily F protein 3
VDWNNRMKAKQAVPAATPVEKKPKEEKKREPIDTAKQKEQKKVQKQFADVERLVADLQQKKADGESKLADPAIYSDKNKFQEAEKNYQAVLSKLKTAEAEYEKLFEAMMSFE